MSRLMKVVFLLVVLSLVVGCDVTVGTVVDAAVEDVEAVASDVNDMVDAAVSDATGLVCDSLGDDTCTFLGLE
jgi:hypothetical protein